MEGPEKKQKLDSDEQDVNKPKPKCSVKYYCVVDRNKAIMIGSPVMVSAYSLFDQPIVFGNVIVEPGINNFRQADSNLCNVVFTREMMEKAQIIYEFPNINDHYIDLNTFPKK